MVKNLEKAIPQKFLLKETSFVLLGIGVLMGSPNPIDLNC
jgi:hypothetical protein